MTCRGHEWRRGQRGMYRCQRCGWERRLSPGAREVVGLQGRLRRGASKRGLGPAPEQEEHGGRYTSGEAYPVRWAPARRQSSRKNPGADSRDLLGHGRAAERPED